MKTQSRQKTQEDETEVFQKNIYKILTYINPFEQNNNHTRISHETEFRSAFKLFNNGQTFIFILYPLNIFSYSM